MTKTDIAKIEDDDPHAVPAFLQDNAAVIDDDGFDDSDIVVPRIKLLQGTSPELEDYGEHGARPGVFWHTGVDEALGTEFEFVPVDRRKKVLLMTPLEDGQGILARADDAITWDTTGEWDIKLKGRKKADVRWTINDLNVAKSGLMKFGSSDPEDPDSPPAATLFYDYLVFVKGREDLGPAVVSLARAAVKKAKKGLNDKVQMHRQNGRPMHALVFKARSVGETNGDGQDFRNWSFVSAGFIKTKEEFERYGEYHGALGRMSIKDETDTNDGATPGDPGDKEGEATF